MTMLSFGYDDTQLLNWVANGATNNDPESFLLLEPYDDNNYKITTNTGNQQRSLLVEINDEDTDNYYAAIRAKAVQSVASKVDDESNLSITITEDKVSLASGATTMSLTNHYDNVMSINKNHKTDIIVSVDAYDVIDSTSRATSAAGKGVITFSNKDNDFTITSGSENIRTQELFPANANDDFELILPAEHLKNIKPLGKIEVLDTITFKKGTGLINLVISISPEEGYCAVSEIEYTIPTHIGSTGLVDNPCDEDVITNCKIGKKELTSSIKYISGAVKGESEITLEAEKGNNFITVKVSDDDGSAKTTIIDADIDNSFKITTTSSQLLKGVKTVTGKEVILGSIETENNNWLAVMPVFKEDADNDSQNSDIIIALTVLT